jgi:outer membrane cobalamin receptor
MRFRILLLLLFATIASAQVNHGELQLKITDPTGARVRAVIHLTSAGNDYDQSLRSDASGSLTIQRIPFGSYTLEVVRPGFAPFSKLIEIRSTLPVEQEIHLQLASVHTEVKVSGTNTLVDPFSSSSAMQIGSKQLEQRLSSLPGRSVQDLVISQPGWLYEGNAVLHPRGSEYQTQFVVDGIPMTDNRSPSFGPEIEADNLDSISIYTAGFPAEYGRKLGGVVELDTRRDNKAGLHGGLVLSGGSYDTASSYGDLQLTQGKNTLGATASGSMTSHYLNPVVPENYTNQGTTGDFSSRYERDLAGSDRLIFGVRHELTRYLVPNERIQEEAGQIQNGDNFETMGTASYQHLASPNGLLAIAGMVRDNSNDLVSNQHPTPIAAFQHNRFREGYLKADYSLHQGNQEFKVGLDAQTTFLHQNFSYTITDPNQFDPDTPPSLSFAEHKPDLEQSAFLEDVIHLNNWTISAGLRWDHYQLLLNRNAFSPRLSVGRYLQSARMVIHGSYDRIFLTPYFENILISGSSQVDALSNQFLRLPVQPSQGNYYEGGITKSLFERMRLDVNVYRRNIRNFADDDQLLNTGVSYPIAFNRAEIYGAEGKLEVVRLQKLTGFASYSYMVGNVWFPVTGGLFLGDSVSSATSQASGHVPVSQDQRNTLWTRFRYSFTPSLWIAAGSSYGSGLPFEYDGTEAEALSQYGPDVISRINFARGRVRSQFSADASLGVTVCKCGHVRMDLQADGDNLNNRLNVIDFNGLFSGNAIGPARSFALRLSTRF